jgi:hypothetical protein
MPETIKAGPVLLEKAISLSHSSLVIEPSRYNSYADLAPKGKPQIIPIKKGKMPSLLILKIFSNAPPKKPKESGEIFEYKKSERIINGKTEPIITE